MTAKREDDQTYEGQPAQQRQTSPPKNLRKPPAFPRCYATGSGPSIDGPPIRGDFCSQACAKS
jgi:hypothetical protein